MSPFPQAVIPLPTLRLDSNMETVQDWKELVTVGPNMTMATLTVKKKKKK